MRTFRPLALALLVALLAGALPATAAAAADPDPSWQKPPLGWDEPPKDALKTRSGLVTRVVQPGTGSDHPRPEDTAVVRYSIWKSDGKLLETWAKRGEPRAFPVGKQIAGWQEGLQLMAVGERRVFWIPEKLAFKGRAGKPRGTLIWDAELVEIRRHPAAPPDVKAPPKDATKTPSGLFWKELAPGKGGERPKKTAAVMVNYVGWTTDGKAFDSTYIDGEPASFTVDSVIPGWTEGLQLMTVGQKVRFWIPKALAYAGKKGKPKGMLVFDVELLQLANP